MSNDVVIRADGLGKRYIIGHKSQESYTSLRDVLAQSAKNLARSTSDLLRGKPIYSGDELEEFWALRDVNFEVRRGEVIGIIGKNGAGKSTLLKVLSRITEPSVGSVQIRGRVASLLEVGTGFHPELTGRENIYLNGAILGMTRSEIRKKFDEIVEFAGVERFLDTPVKRYSSGMYVRLAFSVAAHLEPDILIVDEVLAVGDASFQKKCIGKMGEVANRGQTVLFVSHNMDVIQNLCARGLLFENGKKSLDDTAQATVSQFLDGLRARSTEFSTKISANGATLLGGDAVLTQNEQGDCDLRIAIKGSIDQPRDRIGIGIAIKTPRGVMVSNVAPLATNFLLQDPQGEFCAEFLCKKISRLLSGGEYIVDVWVSVPNYEILVYGESLAAFSIPGVDLYKTGQLLSHEKYGPVLLPFSFSSKPPNPC